MHTDLSAHLHTQECNTLIEQLKTCHEKNKFAKFLGYCNTIDTLMSKCLKQERLRRRENNVRLGKERQASILKRMAENPPIDDY